ncbi:MAG: hypothetical protein AUJ55_00065 [Proteobacteria bacterium CG1_02_64_396]|nr:MAG: hypothetical protein AUJ55_00065 [Proteobacteria bacterium CG1_02_64_396]
MADLHPRLAADTYSLGRFPLSRLLLMNDRTYPWFILVPDREGVSEIQDLSQEDQIALIRESSLLSRAIRATLHPTRINVAALGNMVPQLHVHHIARFEDDPAWPGPVWGFGPAIPYLIPEVRSRIQPLAARLGEDFVLDPQWRAMKVAGVR